MDHRDLGALGPFFEEELARRSLVAFCERMDPRWKRAPHLELKASRLEALERREILRFCGAEPPRYGKTTMARFLAAWWLGKHPSDHVVYASYAQELAEQSGRVVRNLMNSPAYPFSTRLRDDSQSAARFETSEGGVLVAVGVGSGLTGRGISLGLADDLLASREAAESPTIRRRTREWWEDVFLTRLEPSAEGLPAVIGLFGTRWHVEDPMSVAFDGPDAASWETLVLPVFSEGEDVDPLHRPKGALLWPARFGPDTVPSVEKGQISSRSFASLYMCRPTAAEGNILHSDWFPRYVERPPLQKVVLAIDAASKTGIANDFSAFVIIGRDKTDFYVLHAEAKRVEFPDLEKRVQALAAAWHPSHIVVEDASAGQQLVQTLRRATSLAVIPVKATTAKTVRCELLSGLFEAQRVHFPERALWVEDLIDEMTRFPNVAHDDRTDALLHGLEYLNRQRGLYLGVVGDESTVSVVDGVSAAGRESALVGRLSASQVIAEMIGAPRPVETGPPAHTHTFASADWRTYRCGCGHTYSVAG